MKRGRILKVRPFNMANFSGGSGYLPVYFFIEMVAMIPYYWLMAYIAVGKDKSVNDPLDKYQLKKRLNSIVLPSLLILAGMWTAFSIYTGLQYNDLKGCLLLSLVCGLTPGAVTYFSLRASIKDWKIVDKETLYWSGLRYVFLLSLIAIVLEKITRYIADK